MPNTIPPLTDIILRPVRTDDLNAIEALANLAEPGLTSLSRDPEILEKMVEKSRLSFSKSVAAPGDEFYFFVLENLANHTVIGTSSIYAQIGFGDPFYSYVVQTHKRESKMLGKSKDVTVLQLSVTRNGPSEIGTLYLHPEYRKSGVGRLLSIGRFLFIAEHPNRFDETIIAEMRGVSNLDGYSPFWESLGRKFFDIEFTQADYLSSKNKQFIAELMPRYPIYTTFLSAEARAVIGKAHPNTEPALQLLLSEGFSLTGQVDIFDAGPKVSALIQKIRAVSESHVATPTISKISEPLTRYLVSNQNTVNFRAVLVESDAHLPEFHLDVKSHQNLGLIEGQTIRYVTERPIPRENS